MEAELRAIADRIARFLAPVEVSIVSTTNDAARGRQRRSECALHLDPERAAKMGSKHRRRAELQSQVDVAPMEPPKTAGEVRDALAKTMTQVHAHKIMTLKGERSDYTQDSGWRGGL